MAEGMWRCHCEWSKPLDDWDIPRFMKVMRAYRWWRLESVQWAAEQLGLCNAHHLKSMRKQYLILDEAENNLIRLRRAVDSGRGVHPDG